VVLQASVTGPDHFTNIAYTGKVRLVCLFAFLYAERQLKGLWLLRGRS